MLEIFMKIIEFVDSLGYIGIFIMTLIESTFVPIPAEITLIPAGYIVAEGKMNALIVLFCSTCGTVIGSLLNYFIARYYGRDLLLRYGNYFFMTQKRLESIELFFEKHGAISTFSGRMLPGLKHVISFPAGLAKMNLSKFVIYTALGGSIWNAILITLGYYIGQNQTLLKKYISQVNIALVVICVISVTAYFLINRKRRKNK